MATTTIYLSFTDEDLKDYHRVLFELLRQNGGCTIAVGQRKPRMWLANLVGVRPKYAG
jgi:hypothetical protein